jgi:hypothetical protein
MLASYETPPPNEAKDEELPAHIAERKASFPDCNVCKI